MTSQARILSQRQLLESLGAVGAEKDDQGAFKIYAFRPDSMPPQLFLGLDHPDNDILVDNSCYALVDGDKVDLLTIASRAGQGSPIIAIY